MFCLKSLFPLPPPTNISPPLQSPPLQRGMGVKKLCLCCRGRRNYAYVVAEALEEEQEQKVKLKTPENSVSLNQEYKKMFQEWLN